MLDGCRQDVRYAVRSLLRGRGVTAIATASLAIAVAANATTFSLVQAVEFPPLLYPEASRLVVLEARNLPRGLIGMPISAPDAMDIAASSRSLELPSLTADQTSILRHGSLAIRRSGRRVRATFFEALRVPARLAAWWRRATGPASSC